MNTHRRTIDRSISIPPPRMTFSVRGSVASSFKRSTSLSTVADHEVAKPLEKEIEEYEKEYSLYLLRKLQAKMTAGETEREEDAKKFLVSLKKEYEEVLGENVRLYREGHMLEVYGKSLERIDRDLAIGRKVLRGLKEKEFDKVLEKAARICHNSASRLLLSGLRKKQLDDAFEQNALGFDSQLYRLLKEVEEYSIGHKTLVPELADEITEIRRLHAENGDLKERCSTMANQLRSTTIREGYKKYFRMAVEAFRDVGRLPGQKSEDVAGNRSLDDGSFNLAQPASASTPSDLAR